MYYRDVWIAIQFLKGFFCLLRNTVFVYFLVEDAKMILYNAPTF